MSDVRLGESTRQMLAAPPGAVFIWKSCDLTYPRYLAAKHGRGDLNILPISEANDFHFAVIRIGLLPLPPAIVVDHEAKLHRGARRALRYLCSKIGRTK